MPVTKAATESAGILPRTKGTSPNRAPRTSTSSSDAKATGWRVLRTRNRASVATAAKPKKSNRSRLPVLQFSNVSASSSSSTLCSMAPTASARPALRPEPTPVAKKKSAGAALPMNTSVAGQSPAPPRQSSWMPE